MRKHVHQQTAILLRRLATHVTRAARSPDPDAVHDLRVAIRRLSRCLRVFAQFYPGNGWKKMRRRLKDLMDACARVRDRDIALDLLAKGGFPATSIVLRRLRLDRAQASQELLVLLRRWKQRGAAAKWRAQLGI
jgi:CHAD domain-containing protein